MRIRRIIRREFREGGSLLWKIGRFFVSCRLPRVSRENKGIRRPDESVAQLVEQRTLNRSAPVGRLEVEPHHMLEPPESRQYAKA